MTTSRATGRQIGWYHGWNIVAVCALSSIAANGMPINAFSLFLRDWSAELHSPISTLQLGIGSLAFGSAVFSPIAGALADKYPVRWLMAAGLTIIVLFSFGVSFLTETWQFLVLFAVMLPPGLSFATSIPANALVSRWFVQRRGLALGLTAFGLGLAGIVLPPIIAAVMPDLGWRTVWRIAGAVIGLIILPLVLWVLREPSAERDGLHYLSGDGSSTSLLHGHGGGSESGLTTLDVLKRRNFWLLVAVFLPVVAAYGGVAQNLAPIATSGGVSQQTAGVLLSVFSLAYVAASLMMGLLSDRFGNRLPLVGVALATALGAVVIAFGHGVVSLSVGVLLVGISGGLWALLPAAIATEFGAGGAGRGFGMLMMFLPVISPAPFVVAKVQESTGSYVTGLVGVAALTFAGGMACLFLRENRQGRGTGAGKTAALTAVVTPAV